jgi:type II secretory pathway component PulK
MNKLNGFQSKELERRRLISSLCTGKPLVTILGPVRSRARGSEGFILVSVMLLCVMLIATATAYAWFARAQLKAVYQDKIALQARGIAHIMVSEVLRGLKLDTNNYDSPLEPWFQPMFIDLKNYGVANVVLKPLDDKIPLGHLFLPDGTTLRNELKDVWEKMWETMEVRSTLPAKVLDFIDKDTVPRLGGRDGPDNLNRNLFDISELLAMEEITPELLYGNPPTLGIADFCTLWSDAKININVADPNVLALIRNMNKNVVEEIVKFRNEKAITSFEDLRQIPSFSQGMIPILMNLVGFTSTYYNLKIELMDESWNSTRYFDIVFLKSDGRILKWEEM